MYIYRDKESYMVLVCVYIYIYRERDMYEL